LPPLAKVQYEVQAKGSVEEFTNNDSYETRIVKTGDTVIYNATLTPKQAFDYQQKKPFIISVRRIMPDLSYINDTSYAKASETGNWSSDNYGPFKIPAPGELITVDETNFKFYHNIPGMQKGKFTIKEKLYFLLGDNRYGAEDSRFMELISQSKMYGVVK
jgi:hypothetical protein